ncbi:MAG: methyltransferase domain-containing protein [Dehalococcoidia bacterium]
MDAADAFAEVAAEYDRWFETPLGAFVDGQELDALARLLAAEPRGHVVEIGAGTGHVVKALCRLGFQVTAVEPSAAMRAIGERTTAGQDVRWVDARAEALPFAGGEFDGALFFATIEFVGDPGAALKEAFRVVRDGGWVAVGALNALSSWTALYRHEAGRGTPPWPAARFYTRDDLASLAGQEAEEALAAVWLGPLAEPPYDEADQAGQRAGNPPAFELLRWRLRP